MGAGSSLSYAQLLALVAGFAARSLAVSEWTHTAHLLVGLRYLREHGEAGACERLRREIRAYNEATGVPNSETRGYHETITVFQVRAIACYHDAAPDRSIVELARGLVVHRLGSRDLAALYYSDARLFTGAARRCWVAPDLRPLGDLEGMVGGQF